MEPVMIHNTRGNEDVERASLAYLIGNVARSSEQDTTVLLTIDGVWTATKGYTDGLQAEGFAPLADLIADFVRSGGRIWVCGACAKPRGIDEGDLIDGAELIGAATAVEAIVNGANGPSF